VHKLMNKPDRDPRRSNPDQSSLENCIICLRDCVCRVFHLLSTWISTRISPI